MTQGEEQQQLSGVASASASQKEPRQPGAKNGVESSGTSSSNPSSSFSSSMSCGEMEKMPPRYPGRQKQHPVSSDGGDVRTLLHFVNLASDDIKAALDSSTSSTSTTMKVDAGHVMTAEHETLTSEDGYMSVTPSPKSLPSSDKIDTLFDFRYLGNSVAHNTDDTRGKTCAVAPVIVNAVEKLEREFQETKLFKPDMLIMDVPLKDHLQMSSCGMQGDTKVNFEKSLFDKRGGFGDSVKPHGLISPFCEDKKGGGPNDNPVPLRKRRLPASFWQEPGKSENHKTAPPSVNGSLNFPGNFSPIASQNFKMPMMSPLTLHHGNESRLGNNSLSEKGFLYPNSGVNNNNNDTCCSNLGMSFHYASNSALPVTPCMDSLQHRSMALSCGSLCSCHLNNMNNSNYFYEHHHNHGMYPRSQGEFSSLLNSAAVAAAAAASGASPSSPLSRWHHHAQSLHSDSSEICHHTLPRVLKPIPTKTMSSYPPRFHPIFT